MTVDFLTENQQVLNMGSPFNTSADDFVSTLTQNLSLVTYLLIGRVEKVKTIFIHLKLIFLHHLVDDYYTMAR